MELAQAELDLAPAPSRTTRFHRRILAEALALRGAGGAARLAPTLSEARVDLNPHQIEAAVFGLESLPRGGCVLADEVGLGKTVEAGMVIAQLRAEGKKRILILCPATLRAQWQAELMDKFGLSARLVDGRVPRSPNPFEGDLPVIASIPFGANRAADLAAIAWDLVVIDEAHRLRNAYRVSHKTGTAIRKALRNRPKLLLTATPLQNELRELFGLFTLLDETVLGPEAAFRARYEGDAGIQEEAFEDLRLRLAPVVQRTLRRQVKEYVRFTQRRSVVEDFAPSAAERELYEQVSDYLRRSDAIAIEPARKSLLALVYRKLLASSTFAIAPTLRKLADALETRATLELDDAAAFDEEAEEWSDDDRRKPSGAAVAREITELRRYAALAESIQVNAKGEALLKALDRVFTVARAHQWPEKAVVFTESRRTQEYLFRLLTERGHAGQISRLSGDAGTPEERKALIEEFRDRTRILLSTEAGAEGLNLQFCNLVVNYDLPWNPQRLEQRIGRCHRYGQARDVLVINFLNRQNAADARLYELLEKKLHLFDGVFGASDEILGALESGVDFERRILDIYQSCRSPEEINAAFDALRADLDGRISHRMMQARSLLLERFDGEVRRRLRLVDDTVRRAINEREAEATALLETSRGRSLDEVCAAARAGPPEPVTYLRLDPASAPAKLRSLGGSEGWWFAYRFELGGIRPEERLMHIVLVKDGERFRALSSETADAFPTLEAREESDRRPESISIAEAQERAVEEVRQSLVRAAEAAVATEVDFARERLDRYGEDCLLELRSKLEETRAEWESARRQLAQASTPAEREAARGRVERLERDLRRKRAALRAEEDERDSTRDRELAALAQRAKVTARRALVASAYWWLS